MRVMSWNGVVESAMNGLARRIVLKAASTIRVGQLFLELPDGGTAVFGSPSAQPTAGMRITDERFFKRAVLGGEIGFCEAYVDGLWTSDDLVGLFELAILNRRHLSRNLALPSWLSRMRDLRLHRSRKNTLSQSKENIHAHYDLSNGFFRLFLDETMTYSCAVFSSKDQTLADAQRNKYRLISEKAGLSPGDSVLEIGTGWGGFAIYAAQQYGCKVTTVTISEEQLLLAKQRVEEEGLSSRIDVELCDYRDVTGRYDKIVSIEMFEAVGAEYFETFFRRCDDVLRPGGRMCMQVITLPHRSFRVHRDGVNWLQKYIFPGGVLPSLAEIEKALAPTSLSISDAEEIGHHYVETLRRWREGFLANLPAVRGLGFDDRFIRIWECYLASCEAAFKARSIGDVQIVFDKPTV
ncbi:MAG: class I SAM-dependent methyltransferase [Dehalococcoidia bacterium]